MVQQILVLIVFLIAVGYVGRLIWKNFQAKTTCSSGCGKCGIDFAKIEQQLEKKKLH